MELKDISQFKVGETAHQCMTGIDYEVKEYIFTVKKNKRQVESSRCISSFSGKEVIITWNKNKSFI